MKYKQKDKIFLINWRGKKYKVKPVNGEDYNAGPGFSHSFVHLMVYDGVYGWKPLTFCGIDWFEKNAKGL